MSGPMVTMQVPAQREFVSTLRLTAASLAAQCELTIDDIEDLRLAVDEACSLLLPLAVPESTLRASFELLPNCLVVATSVSSTAGMTPDRDGLAWAVLSALASNVEVSSSDGTVTMVVSKRRGTAAAS
jgi:serine/threonine-protein kinase RsbW